MSDRDATTSHDVERGDRAKSPPSAEDNVELPLGGGDRLFKKTGILSRLFFYWVFAFVKGASGRTDLGEGDLAPIEPELEASRTTAEFSEAWRQQEESASGERAEGSPPPGRHALTLMLARMGLAFFTHAFMYQLTGEALKQSIPLMVGRLLALIRLSEAAPKYTADQMSMGLLLCAGILLAQMAIAPINSRHLWLSGKNGMRTKSGLMGLIYEKTLGMSVDARQQFSLGRSVATLSTNVNRVEAAYLYYNQFWFCPIQVTFSLLMIYRLVGWLVLYVVGLILLSIPIQGYFVWAMMRKKKYIATLTDRRLRFLQEMIMGIKAVKLFAWEPVFIERLNSYRAEELREIRRWRMMANWTVLLNVSFPSVAMIFVMGLMTLRGERLNAEVIFAVLLYVNFLEGPMWQLPAACTMTVDALAGVKRIQALLRSASTRRVPPIDSKAPMAISIANGSFSWTLHNKDGHEGGHHADDDEDEEHGEDCAYRAAERRKSYREAGPIAESPMIGAHMTREEMDALSILKTSSVIFESGLPGGAGHSAATDHGCAAEGEPRRMGGHHHRFPGLVDISIEIPRGSLVGIIGPVGSGKSSLLAALFGEMEECTLDRPFSTFDVHGDEEAKGLFHGPKSLPHGSKSSLTVGGTVGYFPQQAWVINANVRENILLGQPFDEERYWRAIRECQMEEDLVALPFGDKTDIGEGGISLSGGQKARMNLARMVYFDRDIMLMDDPLAAVDNRVGKALLEECIINGHTMRNRTRILVTHHLNVLSRCDHVIVMENGHISHQGTYEELCRDSVAFQDLMDRHHDDKRSKVSKTSLCSPNGTTIASSELPQSPSLTASDSSVNLHGTLLASPECFDEEDFCRPITPIAAMTTTMVLVTAAKDEDELKDEEVSDGREKGKKKTVGWRAEEMQARSISNAVYGTYIFACGGTTFVIMLVLAMTLNELLHVGKDIWLYIWVNGQDGPYFMERSPFLPCKIYALLGVAFPILSWTCGMVFLRGGYAASKYLHDRAIAAMMATPIRFFERTPVGRIINRFGRDMDAIDTQVPDAVWFMVYAAGSMLSTLLVIIVEAPLTLILLVVLTTLAFFLQAAYRCGSRQLQRLYATYFSPLMATYSETYLGIPVTHAFHHEDYFRRRLFRATNLSLRASYMIMALRRWVSVYCGLLSALLIGSLAFACFLLRLSSEATGLIISLTIDFVWSLEWFISQFSDLEMSMVAVQRLNQYATDLEVELIAGSYDPDGPSDGWLGGGGSKGGDGRREAAVAAVGSRRKSLAMQEAVAPSVARWPSRGAIEFKDVFLHYRSGSSAVLNSLNFAIRGGERIGIVGRTGAGKTSIMTALMRTVEISSGAIEIDGVDISKISLPMLRGRITVIPQDAVLFAGTLRFNLDPTGDLPDGEIWKAIRKVNMRKLVSNLHGKLDFIVDDFGENFSLGQRQLLCLARAMLRRSKIVLMDEATASMDSDTDAMIQQSIRDNFDDCTIITIAHRLGTIRDYDRIVVMNAGIVAEVGPPEDLLADPQSRLSKLFRVGMQRSAPFADAQPK